MQEYGIEYKTKEVKKLKPQKLEKHLLWTTLSVKSINNVRRSRNIIIINSKKNIKITPWRHLNIKKSESVGNKYFTVDSKSSRLYNMRNLDEKLKKSP